MGLHLHGRPTLEGEESQVDSPKGGRPPPPWKVELPLLVGVLAWVGFPTIWKVLGSGLIRRLGDQHLGFHLYNEGPRGGGRPPKDHKVAAPLSGRRPPLPNPSGPLSSTTSRTLSEAPPDFSTTTDTTPSCCRIQEELLLPLPAGTGRWTSSSSTTERVTEYGGAARSWRRDQDLLRAFASGK